MTHYIYKLTVDDKIYIGYSSRHPRIRLKEHLETARGNKWRHRSLLYPALQLASYECSMEILAEHPHEIPALLHEIKEIEKVGKEQSLNISKGGEGSTVNIRIRSFKNGNVQYKAVLKKKRNTVKKHRRKRRMKSRR